LTNVAGSDPGDDSPFEAIAGATKGGIVLVCDHASNRIPRGLASLGLDRTALLQHVAWDIGAAALTRALAAATGMPAVLSRVSRLVIDCNRAPGHAASIPPASHGVDVPDNRDPSSQERARREREYFAPYHAAIEVSLMAAAAAGGAPALVSVHSFTPVLDGVARPWHVGVLSDHDRRMADPLLAALRRERELVVGDNQPYSGSHSEGYTCRAHGRLHGDARRRPNVLIEVRQDLIGDDAGVAAWTRRLAPLLRRAAQQAAQRSSGSDPPGVRRQRRVTRPMMGAKPQGPWSNVMDDRMRIELEAAAFRRLLKHFDDHKEVQNIDLMNLAHFCRNCLAKWYRAAAEERGITSISYEDARAIVYGMPYAEWKAKYQNEASTEQKATFAAGAKTASH
jgi:predicted N-formylglutamate amidohydrolase